MAHSQSDQQYHDRAHAYTQQLSVSPAKVLTSAEYFNLHRANLMAVGQSDTRTAEEKQTLFFTFTYSANWRNAWFTLSGRQGRRDFQFTRQTDYTKTSDKVAKGIGLVTSATLDAVSDFHRWWNFHFLIRWYMTSCNYCRKEMQSNDESVRKFFSGCYLVLMGMGALASGLWAIPRYFSAWQNQREGRKLENASKRFSNIRWRLWLVPVVAAVGAGLAASFGLPVAGAIFGAVCGLAFSWGYGVYASKYGVFKDADERIDIDGKFIPKKSWLKKISKYPGFENQEVAMYAYAYLTNKMLNQVVNISTSRDYKNSTKNVIEYKLRKQFKHGDLFDVMRYFQEEHARLQTRLGENKDSAEEMRKMRTDFDMLTWLLNNTLNRATQFTIPVPAYYRHQLRREYTAVPTQELPTQVQFASSWDSRGADRMREQVKLGLAPNPYADAQQKLNQMQSQSFEPSAPPAELFFNGYNPSDLPPSYADVIAEQRRFNIDTTAPHGQYVQHGQLANHHGAQSQYPGASSEKKPPAYNP
jgi:hypothetical protein